VGKPFGSRGEGGSSPDGLATAMAVGGGEPSVVAVSRGRGGQLARRGGAGRWCGARRRRGVPGRWPDKAVVDEVLGGGRNGGARPERWSLESARGS
jgi:hypothetical protein